MTSLRLRFLIFIFILSISNWAHSQDYFVSGGVVISKMYSKAENQLNYGIDDFESTIGYVIGISRTFTLTENSEKLYLETELSFTKLGSKYNINLRFADPAIDSQKDDYIRTNYLYLSIPLFYQLSKVFEIGLGPQFSYQLSRKIESNSGLDRNLFDSKIDYGVVFGTRFNITHTFSLKSNIYNPKIVIRELSWDKRPAKFLRL